MCINTNKLLWLDALESSRQHNSSLGIQSTLPKNSQLEMCFGKSLMYQTKLANEAVGMFKDDAPKVLQWYNPSAPVLFVDETGREVPNYVVIEMDMQLKNSAGARDVLEKFFMMDDAAGFHHALRFFSVPEVRYSEQDGFAHSQDPRLLITWQLRPGQQTENGSQLTHCRRRRFMPADDLDRFVACADDIPVLQRDVPVLQAKTPQ